MSEYTLPYVACIYASCNVAILSVRKSFAEFVVACISIITGIVFTIILFDLLTSGIIMTCLTNPPTAFSSSATAGFIPMNAKTTYPMQRTLVICLFISHPVEPGAHSNRLLCHDRPYCQPANFVCGYLALILSPRPSDTATRRQTAEGGLDRMDRRPQAAGRAIRLSVTRRSLAYNLPAADENNGGPFAGPNGVAPQDLRSRILKG